MGTEIDMDIMRRGAAVMWHGRARLAFGRGPLRAKKEHGREPASRMSCQTPVPGRRPSTLYINSYYVIFIFTSVRSSLAFSLLYISSSQYVLCSPSNTSPLFLQTHLPVPLTWTIHPSLSTLFISRPSPPPRMSSASTSITGNAGATAPPSPALTATPPSERSVRSSPPPLFFLSS